jgi:DNA end-binding protein Ku
LWTLRHGDEVRDAEEVFADISKTRIDARALDLVEQVIEKLSTHWKADMARDPAQEKLVELIASKRKGRKGSTKKALAEPGAPTGNVINIMDALRKSLRSEPRSPKSR